MIVAFLAHLRNAYNFQSTKIQYRQIYWNWQTLSNQNIDQRLGMKGLYGDFRDAIINFQFPKSFIETFKKAKAQISGLC